jgi:hypothetical protein
MKPGTPTPERDAQIDRAGEILYKAAVEMEEAGIPLEPQITMLLLTGANAWVDEAIYDLPPEREAEMRARFVKEAGDAFDIAVRQMRELIASQPKEEDEAEG